MHFKPFIFLFFCLHLGFSTTIFALDFSSQIRTRPSQLKPENLAVIVNENDANSVEVANYYLTARQIPAANLIRVKLPANVGGQIDIETFNKLRDSINAKLTPNISAMVLMWKFPFAVNCNSITSALTLGFEAKQCEKTCGVGEKNPYFNSASAQPFRDYKIRLSMLLPTDSVAKAKALIDRGVLSGFALNAGTGYFLKTNHDANSKPRERFFPPDLSTVRSKKLHFRTLKQNSIKDKKDVMFYFTGAPDVPDIETLNFLPGAVADHLTSAGGILDKDFQMHSTKWLDAGATGSYGTVSEPCNHWQKFPNPNVLLLNYLKGDTLIEAYWKSVAWAAQGLFIGEPLAAPFQTVDFAAGN
jgi:uncharacterized protein (TIGR03790 family)